MLEDVIREELSKKGMDVDKICDYDLYLYNRDKARYVGLNDEMILSPRLDDLGSLYPSFEAFIKANNTDDLPTKEQIQDAIDYLVKDNHHITFIDMNI